MTDPAADPRTALRAGERCEIEAWETRFGVVAGITTRAVGDFALTSDQAVGPVLDRWRILQESLGFPTMVTSRQVHGAAVACHDGPPGWTLRDGLDGHLTATPGILLTITVADCIPVYLIAPHRRAAALLHAGWRGVAGRILSAGVEKLVELYGVSLPDIITHFGVGICRSCYEVGPEVRDACGLDPGTGVDRQLDLREVLGRQARELGIGTVSTSQWCSAHHRDRFFSHRASGGRDGRMVAYLGMRI